MTSRKSLLILSVALVAMVLITSGCERSYAPSASDEQASQATPTMVAGDFPGTMPADMDGVYESGAQTSTAIAIASGAPPVAVVPTNLPADNLTPQPITPLPETPQTPVNPIAPSATLPVIATTAVPPTPSGPKPSTYALQKGEFPYCIARRFDVNPNELLRLNGLTAEQARIYEPGLTLTIPQGGASFPSPRALNAHPVSYTTASTMTVYGVACHFGDVDPAKIASSNTIPDLFNIPAGTTLNIP